MTRLAGRGDRKAADATTQDFEYAGIDDHYFMTVALKPGASKVTYQTLSIPAARRLERIRRAI